MADLYLNGPGTDVEGDIFLFGPRAAARTGGKRPAPLSRTVPHRTIRRMHVDGSRTSHVSSITPLTAPVALTVGHTAKSTHAMSVTASWLSTSTSGSAGLTRLPLSTSHNDDDTVLLLTEG